MTSGLIQYQRESKVRGIAMCLVVFLFIYLWWSFNPVESEYTQAEGSGSVVQHPLSKGSLSKSIDKTIHSQPEKCHTLNPLYDPNSFEGADESAGVESKTELAYLNPSMLFRIVESDPHAGIALFRMLSACLLDAKAEKDFTNLTLEGCPQYDFSREIRVHPIELLERSSKLGSNEAKLMYALNAPLVARNLRDRGDKRSDEAAERILRVGEKLGIEAARAGNGDAYRYMSYASEFGLFGNVNLQLAYSFALPLNILGSNDEKLRIQEMAKRLSQKQRYDAQEMAYGCKGEPSAGILTNPFL